MYRWKITSFIVFSSLFWTVSMSSCVLTWLVLTSVLLPATPKEEEENTKEEPHDVVLKNEPEIEDEPKVKKELDL